MSTDYKKIYIKDNLRRIVQGEQLILSVDVDHNSFVNEVDDHNLHYLWTKDGIPFGDEEGDLTYHDFSNSRDFWDRPTVTFDNIMPEDSGIYQCEITNQFGTTTSDAITVEVLDALNTPLLARNIVQNGEMKLGDSGWSIIEGSMEQEDPSFWDGHLKRKGFASKDNLTPSVNSIINDIDYPSPMDGDRLMGQFCNRSGDNEVKIQQLIDLTPIQDVIDRKIEGITTVDIKLGAWLISKRFHPNEGYVYTKGAKENDPSWARATAWLDTPQATLDTTATGQRVNTYWWLRQGYFNDKIELNFIFRNDKGDELRRVNLSSVRTSYTTSLGAFKMRRIEVPIGTRTLLVEMRALRDGNRPHCKRHNDGSVLKMIRAAMWGVNARIYVNGIGDNFNTSYKTWKMPSKRFIMPAVLSYRWNTMDNYNLWWQNEADGRGAGGNDWTFNEASWRGFPAYCGYRDNNGDIATSFKFFNIWRDVPNNTPTDDAAWIAGTGGSATSYDEYFEGWGRVSKTWHDGHGENKYDRWFGRPVHIRDAAFADLGVKVMNVTWLRDYNIAQMDKTGRSKMTFLFSNPVVEGDQADFNTLVVGRRKLILPDGAPTPLIKQDVFLEDIDQAIYEEHAGNSSFRVPMNLLENKFAVTSYDELEDDQLTWYVPSHYLYDAFRLITQTGLAGTTDYGSWLEFIELPRSGKSWESSELRNMYWALVQFYWFVFEIPMEASMNNGVRTIIETSGGLRDDINGKVDINDIYNILKINLQIPDNIIEEKENQIKTWIKKRITQHILDSAFRSMAHKIYARGYKNPEYKEALKKKTKEELPISSANEWGDP